MMVVQQHFHPSLFYLADPASSHISPGKVAPVFPQKDKEFEPDAAYIQIIPDGSQQAFSSKVTSQQWRNC